MILMMIILYILERCVSLVHGFVKGILAYKRVCKVKITKKKPFS